MDASPEFWLAHDLAIESMNLMGTIFAGVSYGLVLALFAMAMANFPYPPSNYWKVFTMTIWLFALSTTSIGLQIRWTVVALVNNRTYPGGPNAYIEQNVGNWLDVMLNAMYVLVTWTADLTILYRFSVIYNSNRLWSLPPVLIFLATLVTGSLSLHQLTIPGTTQSTTALAAWAIAYRTLSLGLNTALTTLIVGRILVFRRRLRGLAAGSGAGAGTGPYVTIATMLVESAALETTAGLVYIVCVGVGSAAQNAVLPVLAQVQVVSPLLIVYRVARGRAWSARTTRDISGVLTATTSVSVVRPALSIDTKVSTMANPRLSVPDCWYAGALDSAGSGYPPSYRSRDEKASPWSAHCTIDEPPTALTIDEVDRRVWV
ncbi:hypothetical protein DENSPDRAFT_579700 [Dentipellis sp. KUC8613]|nr:hypothetical protein DENSPDRAFT_579700 [Dentipellis sp. KUC8613]